MEAITKVNADSFCLPVIQRGYIWEPKKIELLFDSIMRDYPIGTFLFWQLNEAVLNEINFYSFCKYGSENVQSADEKNRIASQLCDDLVGVLDGQQRLTSLYIGSCSKYIMRRGGNDTDKELYIDLTSKNELDKDELLNVNKKVYNFEFKTSVDVKKDIKWFKISNILRFDDKKCKSIVSEIKKKYPEKKEIISNNYSLLCKKIKQEKIIHGMLIKNKNLSEVLEIFERTNSFGKSLKKTDLIFSSIAADWQDAHEEMNNLLKTINSKQNLSNKFDINYIVLSSIIMVGGSPQIKISSLNSKMIKKIKDDWHNISESIIKSADLVSKINMFSSSLRSVNAIIPLSYFNYKNKTGLAKYKDNIRRYLQICVINRIYGVHADTVLKNMIDAIDTKKINTWSLSELQKVLIDGEYAFKVTEEDIDKLLDYEKGDYTLFTLSILYEKIIHINNDSYEQDHMHPRTPFVDNLLINFPNKSDYEREKLKKLNDKLPNLQLLTKAENEQKSDTSLKDYINNTKKSNLHFVPKCSYDVKKFEKFYEERKKLIKKKLAKKFNVKLKKEQKNNKN